MSARVVLLTSFLPNYHLVSAWAQKHDHHLALVVTPTKGLGQYGGGDLVGGLQIDGASLLITNKLKTVVAPAIAALKPDLVLSAAFARLIPPEILDVPAYGALNLHPSPLPAGRGPNPVRLVYEGATTIGATLHRTEAEFDTGAILSQREQPLPDELSGPALLAGWFEMFAEVVEEGTAKALAGEPGTPQDSARASHVAAFTAEELIVDFTEPAAVVCRKVAALNILFPQAKVRLPRCEATVAYAMEAPSDDRAAPGTVLATHADGWTVQTGKQAVRLLLAT